MMRFLAHALAPFTKSSKTNRHRGRQHQARLRVETLEGREVPAVLTPVAAPASVGRTDAQIGQLIASAARVFRTNESLALSDLGQAWSLASKAENPGRLEQLAAEWSVLPAAASGYNGYNADVYYNQAIGACYYWMAPEYGTGSGTDYAYGIEELRAVIGAGAGLAGELGRQAPNAPYARYVTGSSNSAAGYLYQLDARTIPPIAGGTWQVNIGGVSVTYTLTQNVGYASGKITDDHRTGTITETSIQPVGGNWFGSYFTIQWSDHTTQKGIAFGNAETSGEMTLYLYLSNGYSAPITATRVSGAGWTSP
jgi:hypothetical protein